MSDIKNFFRKTHEKFKAFRGRVEALKESQKNESGCQSHHEKNVESTKKIEIEASAGTMAKFILIAVALLILAFLVYQISDILVIFGVSLLFAAALDPMVDALEKRHIPRALGVVIIYLCVLLFLGLFIANLAPIVANDAAQLAVRAQDFFTNLAKGNIELPGFLSSLKPYIQRAFSGLNLSQVGDYKDILLKIANQLSSVAGNVLNVLIIVFNGVVNAILIFVITFLMVVDEHGIDKFILSMFPSKYETYIREKSQTLKNKMGYWLRGQVVLCFVVGILAYIGFQIIGLFTGGVNYAATIAMLAGLTEIIPYAGPFLCWLIAMPIVANQSFSLIIWVTVLMYIVQLLENNLIVPVIMHKAVGISPIFVMFAVLVGFEFLGILGIVLAVPVATAVAIFLKDYADREK